MTLDAFDTFATGLLLAAVLLNLYAFIRHERARRQIRARFDELHGKLPQLIGFAAFMSREESGAPENVREAARQALPVNVQITVDQMVPESDKVH